MQIESCFLGKTENRERERERERAAAAAAAAAVSKKARAGGAYSQLVDAFLQRPNRFVTHKVCQHAGAFTSACSDEEVHL